MNDNTETVNNLVDYMINFGHKDPEFWIDCHNCGRGINRNMIDRVSIYKIKDNELEEENTNNIFIDSNSYLVEAELKIITVADIIKETIYFHWKGNAVSKCKHSPLPHKSQTTNPIVHRICQWSEPPAFFHIFSTPLLVFSKTPNERSSHLFIIRGELNNERHFFEIPNDINNIRINAFYLLVSKQQKCLYTNDSNVVNVKFDQWESFNLKIVKDDEFFGYLEGKPKEAALIKRVATPQLFYFINLSGDYYLTLVEYSLRKKEVTAMFPFLQSHLYTAPQPAIFLLDDKIGNIWLWRGWKSNPDDDLAEFDKKYEMAKSILTAYSERQKECVREICAGAEPDEFKCLFPVWDENAQNLIKVSI